MVQDNLIGSCPIKSLDFWINLEEHNFSKSLPGASSRFLLPLQMSC